MQAWKKNKNIDFDFADCGLDGEISSEDEDYVKSVCRKKLNTSGTFIQLIGKDTKYKYKYVRWEAEVAIEKKSRIIGVNLNEARNMEDEICPPVIKNIGAIFVPFSSAIVNYALQNYEMKTSGNYHYNDQVYKELGYD